MFYLRLSLFTFNLLNKKELGKTKKLQVIGLQRKTPKNNYARDLNNDLMV